jgi:ABC-type multidrug transport system fused ATPase/permease subunit
MERSLALRVLAMFGRRILIVELFRKIVVEVTVHHIERAGIERGETGGGDPVQLLPVACAFHRRRTPTRRGFPPVSGERAGIDGGNDAIRIGEVGVQSFRVGDSMTKTGLRVILGGSTLLFSAARSLAAGVSSLIHSHRNLACEGFPQERTRARTGRNLKKADRNSGIIARPATGLGWYGRVAHARWGSAFWHALAWAVFGSAYVAAVVYVSSVLRGSASQVLLLAAGARLSAYIGATVGELAFLRGFSMDGSPRLAWLEDYASAVAASGDRPVPGALRESIRLDHVSFAYPGTSRVVLEDVSVKLPAGAVVAIVGENGAGKTTFVKLLAKTYEPVSGSIFLDETPLGRVPASEWRERLAGAFQDFFRFEFRAQHTVGLGDVPRLEDVPAVSAAVDRTGARDVLTRLTAGLEGQLDI